MSEPNGPHPNEAGLPNFNKRATAELEDEFEEIACCIGPPTAGLTLSAPLGVGLWAWGDAWTWGFGGYDKDLSEDTLQNTPPPGLQEAFAAALAQGVTLFDTAETYGTTPFYGWGKSEKIIGKLVRQHAVTEGPTGRQPVVATKYIPLPWRLFQPNSLLSAVRRSLARLGLQRIDLYQIHSPVVSPSSIEVLAEALAAAVQQGLVRAVGVSNYSESEMRRTHSVLASRGIPLASNQVEFSLCRRLPETSGLLAACKELDVTLLAYSPLAMGRLTGKYDAANQPKGIRQFGSQPWSKLQSIVDALRWLGERHCKTCAQVALNWVVCKGAIPIPGAKHAQQAKDNAGALGWRLSPQEVELLDSVALDGTLLFGQHG